MTIAPEANAVPAPTWHGSPPDAPQRYLAFVRNGRAERLQKQIAEARASIEHEHSRLESYKDAIGDTRERLSEKRLKLAEAKQRLTELPSTEEVEAEIERIKALPNVLGIRVDSDGSLVVHVRTFVTYEGSRVDLGDFELLFPGGDSADRWPVCYTRLGVIPDSDHNVNCRSGFRLVDQDGGVYYGRFQFNPQDAAIMDSLLENGLIYEFLVLAIARLCEIDEERLGCFEKLPQNPANDPAPTWRGYMDDLVTPVLKALDEVKNGPVREDIAEIESYICGSERDLREYADKVREINATIRRLEAEVSELTGQQGGEMDEKAAFQELSYIKKLPGVMGVRFNEVGVPVFHVRTSHVLEGRRYDLGDFEVALTSRGRIDPDGVLYVCQTRRSRQDYPNYFFHENGDIRNDGAEVGWFCFGRRAYDMTVMFKRGEFGQMMHLLVNTMNGMNEDYRDHGFLGRRYREIPMNAVWRHGRNRPRRRPRGGQAQHQPVANTGAMRTVPAGFMRRLGRVAITRGRN